MLQNRLPIIPRLVTHITGSAIHFYDGYHAEEEQNHPDDLVAFEQAPLL